MGRNEEPVAVLADLIGAHSQRDPTPFVVLRDLCSREDSLRAIANRYGVSRPTVYRAVEPLLEYRLVARSSHGHDPTGLGVAIRFWIDHRLSESPIDLTDLQFLLRADHRVRILRSLESGVDRKADLSRGPETPSRSTAHRAVQSFLDREWVQLHTMTSPYVLTDRGAEALATVDAVIETIKYARERATFLRRCGPVAKHIPLEPLAGARCVTYNRAIPDRLYREVDSLVASDVEQVRLLVSMSPTRLLGLLDSLVSTDVPVEVIVPERLLVDLADRDRMASRLQQQLQQGSLSLCSVAFVKAFPLRIGVVDADEAFLAPDPEWRASSVHGPTTGRVVVSSDAQLVEWATACYEEYRRHARASPERLLL